ncbi:hypothetical protein EO95_04115 [Methanosarcina sp. 1.H.T.1A.1]|nr:hypothetical protein EO93_03085 [Methanosarcina sp. 1.H.A.2.2]KKH92244.1 hypothetical protein EO95_04115 [Methanosarcina sp. 1.H.T.1A.1]
MLTAAKSIYLLTMVLLKIFLSTQDTLSFAGVSCNINFLLLHYAVPEIRFYYTELTPLQANCRLLHMLLHMIATRRLICFDRSESKNKFLSILRKFQINLSGKVKDEYISINSVF